MSVLLWQSYQGPKTSTKLLFGSYLHQNIEVSRYQGEEFDFYTVFTRIIWLFYNITFIPETSFVTVVLTLFLSQYRKNNISCTDIFFIHLIRHIVNIKLPRAVDNMTNSWSILRYNEYIVMCQVHPVLVKLM